MGRLYIVLYQHNVLFRKRCSKGNILQNSSKSFYINLLTIVVPPIKYVRSIRCYLNFWDGIPALHLKLGNLVTAACERNHSCRGRNKLYGKFLLIISIDTNIVNRGIERRLRRFIGEGQRYRLFPLKLTRGNGKCIRRKRPLLLTYLCPNLLRFSTIKRIGQRQLTVIWQVAPVEKYAKISHNIFNIKHWQLQ